MEKDLLNGLNYTSEKQAVNLGKIHNEISEIGEHIQQNLAEIQEFDNEKEFLKTFNLDFSKINQVLTEKYHLNAYFPKEEEEIVTNLLASKVEKIKQLEDLTGKKPILGKIPNKIVWEGEEMDFNLIVLKKLFQTINNNNHINIKEIWLVDPIAETIKHQTADQNFHIWTNGHLQNTEKGDYQEKNQIRSDFSLSKVDISFVMATLLNYLLDPEKIALTHPILLDQKNSDGLLLEFKEDDTDFVISSHISKKYALAAKIDL